MYSILFITLGEMLAFNLKEIFYNFKTKISLYYFMYVCLRNIYNFSIGIIN